jgi:predicted DsbA family dithiol-disulfide isomerase
LRYRPGQELEGSEQRCQQFGWELRECLDVASGYEQRVPWEERAGVEETQAVAGFEHDLRRRTAGRDVAEHAHGRELTSHIEVDPGTIVVYADIGCPWAHVAVHRLHEARTQLSLDDSVRFDIRAFPLEFFNKQPTPKLTLDAEIAVAGTLAPDAGWQMWQAPAHEYPVTTMPALEAVEAAKEQSLRASEQLDRALRRAFFGESRTISMRHVIEEVASGCPEVDTGKLLDAWDRGRARGAVMQQAFTARSEEVAGSPHVFLSDGTNVHNPGVEFHWKGEHGKGFPIVDRDDPSIYAKLLERTSR